MGKKYKFEDLKVWRNAMELVEKIYEITNKFPKSELYSLTNQIRRAAISIALNIAEGQGRQYKKEFLQFIYNAKGSLLETVTCIKIANRLGYITNKEREELLQQTHIILRQLNGLIAYLKK